MQITPIFFATDIMIYILVAVALAFGWLQRRKETWRIAWRHILKRKLAVCALVVLVVYLSVGMLDSIHFQSSFRPGHTMSVLDAWLTPVGTSHEETYSAPFATHLHSKRGMILDSGKEVRNFPRLEAATLHLETPGDRTEDIILRLLKGLLYALAVFLVIAAPITFGRSRKHTMLWPAFLKQIMHGKTRYAWREGLITFLIMLVVIFCMATLIPEYHIFGTNKVGQDVFYAALKGVRTGLVIGTLTTLFMLPFAVLLGTFAGYFGGWIDDVIQYVYTTLSSIPGVLLISAAILSLQVYIANHPDHFPSLESRADMRLLALCMILGVTSWTGLCRLLRAETLKVKQLEFIEASRALGRHPLFTVFRHVVPNVMHIVLITIVLDFSGLVLAEAVLSYVGVGVDPTMHSWGNMINSARLELAREPIVWWPLAAAFIFMFVLVLAANFFADAVRDAFDPKLRNVNA